MMYQNKMAAAIKVGNRTLREHNDHVYMPFGCEYSIFLKNLNNRRAVVKIEIDGNNVTGDGLVVKAHGYVDLERFITDNLNEGNKFKFIERTTKVEEHRGVGVEDGLIRIEWEYEREFPNFNWPIYTNTYGEGLRGSTGDNRIFDTLLNNSTFCSTTNSKGGVQGSSNLECYASAASAQPNDAGITVAGSISDQQFVQTHVITDGIKHVMVMKLLGEVGEQAVEKPLTVDVKAKCPTCGTPNKSTDKFCSECGTGLQIPVQNKRVNLFAYTELKYKTYPAYLSLNQNNNDAPVLSVRGREAQNAADIELPDEEIRKLRDALTRYLNK